MIGVNGWYSANQRSPAGIESVGTNPLPRNGSRISGIGRLLAVSTLLLTRPSATDSQTSANVTTSRNAGRGQPPDRPGGGPEADQQGDADHDRQADHRLDHGCRGRAR